MAFVRSHCACGEKNSINCSLKYKKGGTISEKPKAEFMKEVCCDFRIEPQLIPIANVNAVSGNIANLGRLDYQVLEYGDQWKIIGVRVLSKCALIQNQKYMASLSNHEQLKKRAYNERIIQIRGLFSPIDLWWYGQ